MFKNAIEYAKDHKFELIMNACYAASIVISIGAIHDYWLMGQQAKSTNQMVKRLYEQKFG